MLHLKNTCKLEDETITDINISNNERLHFLKRQYIQEKSEKIATNIYSSNMLIIIEIKHSEYVTSQNDRHFKLHDIAVECDHSKSTLNEIVYKKLGYQLRF